MLVHETIVRRRAGAVAGEMERDQAMHVGVSRDIAGRSESVWARVVNGSQSWQMSAPCAAVGADRAPSSPCRATR